jgi:hypothetical protein
MGLKNISDRGNFAHMQKIERDVFAALKPYRDGQTEAMLVVFALLRVAKMLVRFYPVSDQNIFRPLLVAFINEDKTAPGVNDSPLWMPPTNLN